MDGLAHALSSINIAKCHLLAVAKIRPPKKRKFGKGVATCRRCGTSVGVIRKYKLYICRRCINEVGPLLGFKVYN
jgi:small subunit ribosomal protein S14